MFKDLLDYIAEKRIYVTKPSTINGREVVLYKTSDGFYSNKEKTLVIAHDMVASITFHRYGCDIVLK